MFINIIAIPFPYTVAATVWYGFTLVKLSHHLWRGAVASHEVNGFTVNGTRPRIMYGASFDTESSKPNLSSTV